MAGLMTALSPSGDALLATLGNGVRVVAIPLPHLESASVSVFVHSGSAGESRKESGISHFIEHMAFKGTSSRSCQQINLDAEQLGADVNAHTDKDHTAFHMRGMARDAGDFVRMLGDIVLNASFPEAELERERQVLLQEYIEDEEDPISTAFKLFDRLSFGSHPAGLPVIGLKGNIGRFSRDDLLGFVESRYVGANVVVGAAGGIDPGADSRRGRGDLRRPARRRGRAAWRRRPIAAAPARRRSPGWARRTSSTACRCRRSPTRRSMPMPSPRRCSAKA